MIGQVGSPPRRPRSPYSGRMIGMSRDGGFPGHPTILCRGSLRRGSEVYSFGGFRSEATVNKSYRE